MRQITAFMPAAKTQFCFLLLSGLWGGPLPFASDQFAHARIERRSDATRFEWLPHAVIEP
jgi:hypothetical protein